MANIHIKTDDQRERESFMLRATGNRPSTANAEQREYAECAARRTVEALKDMGVRV